MTIKGSLLMSLPIIKHFRPKIVPSKGGLKIFGDLGGEMFDVEVETHPGNQSPPEHVV